MSRANRETPEQVVREVGRRVAEIRLEHGWTQQEAAEYLGMAVRSLQRIEAGSNMTIATAARLARKLGVPTADLFRRPRTREWQRGRRRGRPRSR